MKPVRPFRDQSVYAAACIDCQEEIEAESPDVPLRCPSCRKKWQDLQNARDGKALEVKVRKP